MRRSSTVLTTLALTASTLVLAQPASAVPPLDDAPTAARAGKPKCTTGMVLATEDGSVRYDVISQDEVTGSRKSAGKLPFDAEAWGYFGQTDTKKTTIFRVNTVTPKGMRQVSLNFTGSKKIGLSSIKYAPQSNFKPRLYADNYTYYAYIVTKGGDLQRWTLTRYPSGAIRYASKVKIASGYDSLTSLQATDVFTLKGVSKEVLYGTTEEGALLQITVPLKKPTNEKVRTMLDTGYAGVTELSWSTCNDQPDYTSLVAVDPELGTATWTTIKDSNSKPKPTIQGAVTGGDFTGVTALL